MQPIERGGYSREEILDVLHSKNNARNVKFRYDLYDMNNRFVKTLDTVMSGQISMSAFSTIKRTAKFKLEEKTVEGRTGLTEFDWETYSNEGTGFELDNLSDTSDVVIKNGWLVPAPYQEGFLSQNASEFYLYPEWDEFLGGVHPDWNTFGSSRGEYGRSLAGFPDGASMYMRRTSSGTFGIYSNDKGSVKAGDTVYLSFFFRPLDYGTTGSYVNFEEPNDCRLRYDVNGGYEYFTNYTIHPVYNTDNWYRFEGQVQVSKTDNVAVQIGWDMGSDGAVIFDNVYVGTEKPVYELDFTSAKIPVSRQTQNPVVNRIRATSINGFEFNGYDGDNQFSEMSVEWRYSTDYGNSWSDWRDFSSSWVTVNDIPANDLMFQYRMTSKRVNVRDYPYIQEVHFEAKGVEEYELGETTEINYLSDRIKPYMLIKMPDGNWIEYPLGVFHLSTPTRKDEMNKVYREIEAYDGLIILDEDKFQERYTIPAGTKYTDAVKEILRSAGIEEFNITDKADTLNSDKEFKIGDSKLKAVNDLLDSINYTPIWVDANGYFTAYQYISPADRAIDYTYEDNELSVTFNGMEEELDLSEVANSWVVVQSNPEEEPLISTKVNDSVDSPTSTVNRGRTVVDFREVEDISSQESLDNYVERIAFEASQVYGKVKFKTALMPFHEYYDVLRVKYSPLGIDHKFSETSWTMKLEAGGEMEHEVRRVVSI